jgi:uncharacterized membrane protein (DUF485 family)
MQPRKLNNPMIAIYLFIHSFIIYFTFYFLVAWSFEFRYSLLLGGQSTTWAISQAFRFCYFSESVLCVLPGVGLRP